MGNGEFCGHGAPSDSSSSKSYLTGQYALAAAAAGFIWSRPEQSGRLSPLGRFGFIRSRTGWLPRLQIRTEVFTANAGHHQVVLFSYRASCPTRYPAPPHMEIILGRLPDRIELACSKG